MFDILEREHISISCIAEYPMATQNCLFKEILTLFVIRFRRDFHPPLSTYPPFRLIDPLLDHTAAVAQHQ